MDNKISTITEYINNITVQYSQLCQRSRDNSIYGIAEGKQCRLGRPIPDQEYNQDLDLIRVKEQGKQIKQLLQELKKRRNNESHRDYIERGIRSHKDEIKEIKRLINPLERDRILFREITTGLSSLSQEEQLKVLKRYRETLTKIKKPLDRIRSRLISKGDPKEAENRSKQVLENSILDTLPSPKKPYSETLEELYRLTNNKVNTLGELIFIKPRASARPPKNGEDGKINVGEKVKEGSKPLWHEFGHHVEFSSPDLRDALNSWLLSRSTGKIKRLSEITGNSKYQKEEVAYEGNYGLGAYVGRYYGDGFTEVFSKGLEKFESVTGMLDFYSKDPEHFFLILGILDSL